MGNKQRKLMFFIGSMGKGGAERVIANLANYYAKKNWQVEIVMLLSDTKLYSVHPSVRLIPLCNSNRSRLMQLPTWIFGIRSLVRHSDPTAIIAFAARINVLVLLSCLGLKKKVIISERNDPKRDKRTWPIRVAVSILYPLAYSIVFQTNSARCYFRKSLQRKGMVISNPVCVTALRSTVPSKKIVSIGRLSAQKNHKLLVESFKQFHKNHPDYVLIIYGEGELRESLERQIEQAGLSGFVFLPGICENIHEIIADACLFVLSSNYEGLSNALLEAMMMGIPCISTACAGSTEYIINGVNGFLSPVGDVGDLLKAMETVVSDDNLRKRIGDKGRKTIEDRCSYHKIFTAWDCLIERL